MAVWVLGTLRTRGECGLIGQVVRTFSDATFGLHHSLLPSTYPLDPLSPLEATNTSS